MRKMTIAKRIRWKLRFECEQMDDIYLEEEIINTDTRRAAPQRKEGVSAPVSSTSKPIRGVRAEIIPAWIKMEFSYRGAPSSKDDSRRAKSEGGEQMDIDEDTSGTSSIVIIIFRYKMLTMKDINLAEESAVLPIAKFARDIASLRVQRFRLVTKRAEKVHGQKTWNWPAVFHFLGGGKSQWKPNLDRNAQEDVLSQSLVQLREHPLYKDILQPFESGFKLTR